MTTLTEEENFETVISGINSSIIVTHPKSRDSKVEGVICSPVAISDSVMQ